MKLARRKMKPNGGKSREGIGCPRLQLSVRSFSNTESSHGITFKSGGYRDLQGAFYVKTTWKL